LVEKEGKKALILDTEGLGALDVNKKSDSRFYFLFRIFLIAMMLASTFIFNSVGTIDENALNDLSLIINLAKSMVDK